MAPHAVFEIEQFSDATVGSIWSLVQCLLIALLYTVGAFQDDQSRFFSLSLCSTLYLVNGLVCFLYFKTRNVKVSWACHLNQLFLKTVWCRRFCFDLLKEWLLLWFHCSLEMNGNNWHLFPPILCIFFFFSEKPIVGGKMWTDSSYCFPFRVGALWSSISLVSKKSNRSPALHYQVTANELQDVG